MTAPADDQGFGRQLTTYGDPGFSRFLRQAFLLSAGFDEEDFDRPIVGIADSSSDYVTCHRQMPELVNAVRRGVSEAGAIPVVFPTMSIPEILISPTSMLFRNLMAMEVEEQIRSQPMDAVVLVGGCDKTVPAQLMAAVSADLPSVSVVAGPMLPGEWNGERLGACTDCRRLWADHRGDRITGDELSAAQAQLCPTAGTCMVMGTASTMACVTEALGLMETGGATPPAATGARLAVGVATGRRAAALAGSRLAPSDLLSPGSFHNAVTVLAAIGGSTNAVIHLLAIAGRAGIPLSLDDIGTITGATPLLVDCKPAGSGYLPDLDRAGGLPRVLVELRDRLDLTAMTVAGVTLGEILDDMNGGAPTSVVRTIGDPLGPPGPIRTLRGSLAPGGAVIKAAAASPELLKHRGPALVIESPDDADRLDDPDLDVSADTVLVLRNAGPIAAGMPEAGSLPIPRRLARQGVTDMVRVSDARMSGTAYGTVVLHVTPEAAAGGPLALVRDGDMIELDVEAGRVDLLVDDDELTRRRAEWSAPALPPRGWPRLYADHVTSASEGADLDFLRRNQ